MYLRTYGPDCNSLSSTLWQGLGRVALVWRDHGAIGELLVRVGRVDDEVGGIVDHGEGGLFFSNK